MGSSNDNEDEGGNLWLIGVAIMLVGSLGQNLGNNLVALAHAQKNDYNVIDSESPEQSPRSRTSSHSEIIETSPEKIIGSDGIVSVSAMGVNEKEKEVSFFKKHLWGIGTTIIVISSIMCFFSFGFAAQSLLASLESIQFVSNIGFAKFVHKERISWMMIFSTFLIVCGNALVVFFSGHHSILLDGNGIFDLYAKNTKFHIYLAFCLTLLVVSEYSWKLYHHSRINDRIKLWNHSFMEPLCFCIASAIVGSFAVVNAKNMSMLLAVSASTDRNE
jgi:hypothetical protein